LRAKLNFGQFVQGENVPYSLVSMVDLAAEKKSLDLFSLRAVYDMAGASGSGVIIGTLVLTHGTYSVMRLATKCLEMSATNSHQEVSDSYLEARGRQLNLNPHFDLQRALIRIACMSRYHTDAQASILIKAFNELDGDVRYNLSKELDTTGLDGEPAILLYFCPALLEAFLSAKVDGTPIGAERGLQQALLVMNKVFKLTRARILNPASSSNGVFTVDVNNLAKKAKVDPLSLPGVDSGQDFLFLPTDSTTWKISVKDEM